MTWIAHDFRSDTVTKPNDGMRRAMADAEVGDDVYGDDPTVNRLEATLADMLGHEAALFLPSGTQSNLAALMSHCGRGDEYIAGMEAHCYVNEAGGAAVLGSIQPQPLPNEVDGTISLSAIAGAIKPDDIHFARTRLLALENTIGGKVLPSGYVGEAVALARRFGLGTHLDGARLFNAAIAGGQDAREIARNFDTISVCLSKGLGAPAGSVLVGHEDLVDKARRIRKMLGGGMRQVGILAAAGLYALENNIDRLAEDHEHAKMLGEGLARYPQLKVEPVQTNMVFVTVVEGDPQSFEDHLRENGIGVHSRYGHQRWVTHLDVGPEDVEKALEVVDALLTNWPDA
ncbi:MAG: low-specificity L-threonine aldolase [Hyphomicrobiaceae bacterium]|nr:low-specificity L-threonine aldolase [Hyphomicrobiaceae bacterium]MCC0023227.1 low-specificity L-threonine aldolase [Hyphomicrobiaceae bacterium]